MKIVGLIEKFGNPLPFRYLIDTAISKVVFHLSPLYYALIPFKLSISIDLINSTEIANEQYVKNMTYVKGYIFEMARPINEITPIN